MLSNNAVCFFLSDHHYRRQRDSPPSQPPLRLSVPLHPHPPPHTPSHPLGSPLTASTILANISSFISHPSSAHNTPLSPIEDGSINTRVCPVERVSSAARPSSVQNIQPSIGEEMLPDAGSGFLNHTPDHLVPPQQPPTVDSMEVESSNQVQASKTPSKKSKSRSKKRKKHKQSRVDTEDNTAAGEDLPNSSEGLQHPRRVDRGTLHVDQLNPRAYHASTNGMISDTQLEGDHRARAPPQKTAVRVKEEPISDTEETCHRVPATKVRVSHV